jgi:guanine deaminase
MFSVRGRLLTPVGPEEVRFLPDAVLAWDERGVITEVGPYLGQLVDLDVHPGVLLPGFVDAHVHYPQTRIVGRANGPLLPWLATATFPEEARFADRAYADAVADEFVGRLAAAGTTLAFVYGSSHDAGADALLAALGRSRLKAIAGPVWMDEDAPDALLRPAAESEALVERLRPPPGVEIAVIPRFALSCSAAALARAGTTAARGGRWISTHVSENVDECRLSVERFGAADPLAILETAGLVGARTVLAHCIHLSDSEWDRFAAAGAIVAHCPDSNDFLGSGGLPVHEVLRRRIPIAIGSDVAAGRTFRIPRVLSCAYDNGLRHGVTLSPERLLWWGTRGGALALAHTETGLLTPGCDADLCVFPAPPNSKSAADVFAALLFDHDAPAMSGTWVRGRPLGQPNDATARS